MSVCVPMIKKCLNFTSLPSSKSVPIQTYLSFSPPKTSYKVLEENFCGSSHIQEIKIQFLNFDNYQNYSWISFHSYKIKDQLIVAHLHNRASKTPTTIIYSHGNKGDLGTILPFLYDLSAMTKSDVIAYDYNGYGCSSKNFSQSKMTENLNEVVRTFYNMFLSKNICDLVLMSFSFGADCVLKFIETTKERIKGVLLVSPVLFEMENEKDNFCLYERYTNIRYPMMIMYGLKENIVIRKFCQQLIKKKKDIIEWNPSKGNHSNLMSELRQKFYVKLGMFLNLLKRLEPVKKNISNTNKLNQMVKIELCKKTRGEVTPCVVGMQENSSPLSYEYFGCNSGSSIENKVFPNIFDIHNFREQIKYI